MSEITKECPSYSCEDGQRIVYDGDIPIDKGPCVTCKGTGRVPDVEATLRAEVARLTEELTQAKATMQVYSESRLVLCSQVTRITATLAERDGEVAKSAGSVVWQRGRIQTPDLGPYDDRDEAAERQRYLVVFNDGCLDIGPLADLRAERQLPDVVAWACVEMPDAAWLAGRKS